MTFVRPYLWLAPVFLVLTIPVSGVGQEQSKPMAVINTQTGRAFLRRARASIVVLNAKKDLGRLLYPREEIRCEKGCVLQLTLCTGSRLTLKDTDGWYRVPVLICTRDQFLPGLKNYFLPGGRKARVDHFLGGEILGAIIGVPGAYVGAAVGLPSSLSSKGFRQCPLTYKRYDRIWEFYYPFEGAVVFPSVFSYEMRLKQPISRMGFSNRLSVSVTFSTFDEKDPLHASRSLTEDFRFEDGNLKLPGGIPYNSEGIRSFLTDTRKLQGPRARVYCVITVGEIITIDTGEQVPLHPHSFGFEFTLASEKDEKRILDALNRSDAEAGVARHFGRAEVFENIGLFESAKEEYGAILQSFPGNVRANSRLKILSKETCVASYSGKGRRIDIFAPEKPFPVSKSKTATKRRQR